MVEPSVARGDGGNLRLGDHRNGGEVESVERLACEQPAFGQMAFDPAPSALGEFVLGNRAEKLRSRPANGPRRSDRRLPGRPEGYALPASRATTVSP